MTGALCADALLYRLDWRDAGEIAAFLNRTWDAGYGSISRPRFDAQYLSWLYGGPAARSHLLIGRRLAGRLAGFKALLWRPVTLGGSPRRAHLSTHLSVDPTLSLTDRLTTLTALVRPHALVGHAEWIPEPDDLGFAFYDAGKRIVRDSASVMERHGLVRSEVAFQQAIVNPVGVQGAAARLEQLAAVRRAVPDDLTAIGHLLTLYAERVPLAVIMPPEQLRHHLFALPDSEVHLAGEPGTAGSGAIGFHGLTTVRPGHTARVVVVELLVAPSPEVLIPLLTRAVAFAQATQARGVVLENATHLDQGLLRACGVVLSTRHMLLAVLSRNPIALQPSFLADIK